jgi:hypothetical protein
MDTRIPVVSPPQNAFAPRQRDRRAGWADLLTGLTRALGERTDGALTRGAFELALGQVVPVRSVRLRDGTSRWQSRTESGAESIALEVPGGVSAGVLEATFDPGTHLAEWDFQFLGLAAQLAALVLEIDRLRLQLARAGLLPAARARRESAAPLIGSTPAMHILRAQIDRVADTDFTVLLEGGSGAEVRNQFCLRFASFARNWAVEGAGK